MRLLSISNFKKLYLEKAVAFRAKVHPTIIKSIRDMEDGIKDYRELNLSNIGFDDAQLAPLVETLRNDTNIRTVNLSNNKIRSLEQIIGLLQENTTITSLDLSNNRNRCEFFFQINLQIALDCSSIACLIETARNNSNVRSLNLKNEANPNHKTLISYTFDSKTTTPKPKALVGESPNRKCERKNQSLLSLSIETTNNISNISLVYEDQSITSTKEDHKTHKNFSSKGKMSRMEWIFHLKKIFDEIKKKNRIQIITAAVIIESINANILRFPLVDENFYKQTKTDLGYSVDEIVRKLSEKYDDPISYDDILDAISQVNKRSSKVDSSTSSAGSYYNRYVTSEYGVTRTAVKLTDIVELGGPLQKPGQPSADLRERKNKYNLISERNQAMSNSTDVQLKYHRKNLLDDLSINNEKNTTFEFGSPKVGSELNSFQQISVDMNRISDCSAIEINERSETESDWLATNDSNTEIRRALQSEYSYPGSVLSQQVATRTLYNQPISNDVHSATHALPEKPTIKHRQHTKAPSIEISSRIERSNVEDSQFRDLNSKNKSAQMLKSFLDAKTKVETPVKVVQVRSYINEQPPCSANLGSKLEQTSIEKPVSLSKNIQRPPLSTTCNNISLTSERGFLSPQNYQKIPITKVSLGKNAENTVLSPTKGGLLVRESGTLTKPATERNVSHASAVKQPVTQTITVERNNQNVVAERNVQTNPGFQTKFSELLTSFNTFYNENSSLISNTDLSIINMINGYSTIKDTNNAPKVGVCFGGLQSIEISEILIYPLLKAILCYVELLRIKSSLLSQDSFSELISGNLLVLNLSSNNVNDLRCLKACRNLEFINLHNNDIEEIKGFIMCPKMKEIILSSNKLRVVKNLSKLSELKLLDLSDNLVDDRSSLRSLQQNPALKYLNFKGNPLASRIKYRIELLELLPQLSCIDAELQKVSEFTRYGEFSLGRQKGSGEEEESLPKKLVGSKSFVALNAVSFAKRGVLKNSASNLRLNHGLSPKKSHSRSVTPSGRKTSFYEDIESFESESCKYKDSKNENEEVFTINLDINNLDS